MRIRHRNVVGDSSGPSHGTGSGYLFFLFVRNIQNLLAAQNVRERACTANDYALLVLGESNGNDDARGWPERTFRGRSEAMTAVAGEK